MGEPQGAIVSPEYSGLPWDLIPVEYAWNSDWELSFAFRFNFFPTTVTALLQLHVSTSTQ